MAITEKILQTRLQLKYDTYANWTTNNPVLKAGEMAVATIPSGTSTTPAMTNLPNIVLKVGDGETAYNDLKFVSALAADVHGWAKEASKPTYAYNEITGLEQFIKDTANAEIQDTDTQYTISAVSGTEYKFELKSKGLGDAAWTKVADIDLTAVGTRLSALEGLVGTTKVADQITNAINALDKAIVTAGQGEIIESVKQEDGVVTATKRALVAADIPVIAESQVSGLTARLAGIDKAVTDGDAKTLSDAKSYADSKVQNAINGLDKADAAVANQFVTAVSETDGVITVSRAQPTIANVEGLTARLSGIEGDITDLENNKQDNLTFDGTYNASSNKAATVSSVETRINALDYAGGAFGTNKFVTKVTENDGIVEAEYARPVIADIEGLNDRLTGIDTAINGKQDTLTFTSAPNSTDNRVATEKFVLNSVADLNGAMHFVGKLDAVPGNVEGYKAGDVILVGYDEYVCDGNTWLPLGNESIYQTTEQAGKDHEAINNAITALEKKHDDEMDALEKKHNDELAALDGKYDAAIKALDKGDTAVAGQFVSAVSETDGIITVSRRALVAGDFANDVVPEAAVDGLTEKLAALNKAVTDGDAATLTSAKSYADTKVQTAINGLDKADSAVEKQFVTAVSETDGVITVSRAALKATDIPTIEQSQVNGLVTALANKDEKGAAATALSDAKTYADNKVQTAINGLDKADSAVEKNVVTAVSQTDGVISVTRAPLAEIAWSGEAKDLKQTDTILVLNCGSSSVNI